MHTCEECGVEVETIDGISSPVNKKLSSQRTGFIIPFSCSLCGSIKFPLIPIRDVVLLFPIPRPKKIGSIHIPDYDGRTYNTQEYLRRPLAVVLAVGKGYYDKKRFHPCDDLEAGDFVNYNKQVPWKTEVQGTDGLAHTVVMCGYKDVLLKLDEAYEMKETECLTR